jgi:hypothetical protein
MINLEIAKASVNEARALAQEGIAKANANKQMRAQCEALANSISALEAEVGKEVADLEVLSKAAVILANVSEECTNQILNAITGAIILGKDIPTALKIVNSESLLILSKVNNVPNNKPTGNALSKIFGNS